MFVVDASVFAKIVVNEADSSRAREALASAMEKGIPLLAPNLLVYELLGIGLHFGIPARVFLDLLDAARNGGMRFVEPDRETSLLAESIALGDRRFGMPSLQDSIYHAIAIANKAELVTADRSHFNKTRHLGHIKLLKDWQV